MSVVPVDLWPQLRQKLESKYKILDYINLWPIDANPSLLYQRLESLYKPSYAPNEKILIAHYDTDYYVNGLGFTLYNLFQSLKALDISPSVIIFTTNHYGISKEIAELYKKFCPEVDYKNDHPSIIENSYLTVHTPDIPVATQLDVDSIIQKFICLCGTKRSHRVLFLSGLKNLNLLNQGICSWHFDSPTGPNKTEQLIKNCPAIDAGPNINFLTTVPYSRLNEYVNWDNDLRELVNQHHSFFNSNFKDPLIDGNANKFRFDLPAIKKAFLYVSIETVFSYPYPYLTEKTFKAILQKRPFVIVGAPRSLEQLRKFGFKTFSKFWNEDYDLVDDHSRRIKDVLAITEQISSMTVVQLQELCYSMKDVLEYNFQHYLENYSKTDFKKYLETI